MMNRTIPLLIIYLSLLFLGCDKNGGVNEKKMEGVWEVEQYKVDGFDSTQFVKYSDVRGYRFVRNGELNPKDFYAFHFIKEVKTNGDEINFGHWGERKNNKMMLVVEYKTENIRPFTTDFDNDAFYDIVKYERKKAWFEQSKNGHFYEIHLKLID